MQDLLEKKYTDAEDEMHWGMVKMPNRESTQVRREKKKKRHNS